VSLTRRRALVTIATAAAGSAVFGRALAAVAGSAAEVTDAMIREASWISGVPLDDEKRKLLQSGLKQAQEAYAAMRAVSVDNAVPPALRFDATPGSAAGADPGPGASAWKPPAGSRPRTDADVAFASVGTLAGMLRSKKISSVELTKLYLERLKRHDPKLLCAIAITEELALKQAEAADRELAKGVWRGPLHGIPWGAKDLIAVPGYPTTWGSVPFKAQVRPEKATVAERLERAGAVLVAKTAVGELAWGDVWFGGMTRNPWKPDQGSSGSSAGSASAVAAGLVGFAIGTETWGSIVSPCTRCGASGLRPTFGRVSRAGVMALSWSMDKLGPIARSVEDLALVFASIHGADSGDAASTTRPFAWPPRRDPKTIRVGFVASLFDFDYTKWGEDDEERRQLAEWKEFDQRSLKTLRTLGYELVPVELPDAYPVNPLQVILTAEAATAFDDLTRSGRDGELVRQVEQAWPNVFRQGQFIPAVEYLRANRIRTLVMQAMEEVFRKVDVYVVPSFGGDNLLRTNLTGHPAVVVPNGFRASDGTPTSLTFQGPLHGDDVVLAVAQEYQRATDFHRQRPPEFSR
jgi:Asp-tRNA(Asn)/Glu-tRNA(Gln) amidotransferase A subunit family amidase